MVLVGCLVLLFMGPPVLFRQRRPGRFEQPFVLLKFRTMSEATGPDGQLLPDGARLGRFGRLLRSTSLDELPELINVLKGEMSLVGPRPLLTKYLPYYTASERARFLVRPGITGLSQVSGRNDLSWGARCSLDSKYAQACSLALDLRIILLTISRVISRHGLRTDPGAVMADLDVERNAGAGRPSNGR
jgi:lipopolysaccharide/colanic/teichoic acid biosynthesis glycosyltransferase